MQPGINSIQNEAFITMYESFNKVFLKSKVHFQRQLKSCNVITQCFFKILVIYCFKRAVSKLQPVGQMQLQEKKFTDVDFISRKHTLRHLI